MPAGQSRWLFSLISLLSAGFSRLPAHRHTHIHTNAHTNARTNSLTDPRFHLLFSGGDQPNLAKIGRNFTETRFPSRTPDPRKAKQPPSFTLGEQKRG
uniref:Putative secreted peptide n=1 Tax=Anopheles braziliensis TaxID=58242 RepID=A0A2M3ZU19_9DIPT